MSLKKSYDREFLYRGGVPLHLWSQGTIVPFDSTTPSYSQLSGANKLDITQLMNPYRTAFVIDAIKMLVYNQNGSEIAAVTNLGGVTLVRFSMDHLGISQGFVPMWLYGPRLQSTFVGAAGVNTDYESSSGSAHGNNVDSGNAGQYAHFYWRLPKPLLVPPGSALVPDVQASISGSGTMTFEIAYAGRRLPPNYALPKTAPVPFAAAFVSLESNSGGAATAQFLTSPDNGQYALRNPFQSTLHMSKLLYRLQGRPAQGTGVMPVNVDNDPATLTIMTSSRQKMIDNVASYIAFDETRKAWSVDYDLPPGEYITAQINDPGLAAFGNANRLTYGLSMTGWREEAY